MPRDSVMATRVVREKMRVQRTWRVSRWRMGMDCADWEESK